MDQNLVPHFHIRWTTGDNSRIDWEPFESRGEANRVAELLAKPSESYEITEFDDSCSECATFRQNRKMSR